MLSFLDPRIWLAAAIAIALSFGGGYFKGSHAQRKQDELERLAAISQANDEARKMEQRRQQNVDDAARAAAARERGFAAAAAGAHSAASGLRGDLDAVQRASAQSLTASNNALRVASELLGSCTAEYLGVAEAADRATSEAMTLRQAWPK